MGTLDMMLIALARERLWTEILLPHTSATYVIGKFEQPRMCRMQKQVNRCHCAQGRKLKNAMHDPRWTAVCSQHGMR
jgi:hypothetical protein